MLLAIETRAGASVLTDIAYVRKTFLPYMFFLSRAIDANVMKAKVDCFIGVCQLG